MSLCVAEILKNPVVYRFTDLRAAGHAAVESNEGKLVIISLGLACARNRDELFLPPRGRKLPTNVRARSLIYAPGERGGGEKKVDRNFNRKFNTIRLRQPSILYASQTDI